MKLEFKSDKAAGEILAAWWEALQRDSGGRAQLRRCKNPEEVMLEPTFHRLLNRLQPLAEKSGEELCEGDLYRLAAIAGLLAHVTGRDNKPLAERMAESKGGRPLFSSLRFRRLLKEPLTDLYPAMIRVIRQLDKKANLFDLANTIFYWGDTVRKRWAMAYFPKVVD
ncbi:type I-E CRISPR-associated protein Cse2/CasB [Sedimenticola hydrogenitrophicus]|uniref:type I-E CRISPR-associated protein Cse2/CasB n=1 Tax=Sedimenticola hydrogenitrophicus TaxID=2967975 RepID=UPI0023B1E35D|nr:type I-E CRISPR-associated protein Cse2/CasB [Sedimenticola hydrogenitrophicus]